MAVSTNVFAPIVKTVQPAFIYNQGEVKIYFSFSPYDNADARSKIIKFTIIDPNKRSTWGNNYLTPDAGAEVELDDNNTDYFTIDPLAYGFKPNQYYQMQIYIKDIYGNYSAPSQTTLLRPIPIIDTFEVDELEKNSGNTIEAMDLKELTGSLSYTDGSSKEYLAKYKICISEKVRENNIEVYNTGWKFNIGGLTFSQKIDYSFTEGSTYKIDFIGETVNGYIIEKSYDVTIANYSAISKWENFTLVLKSKENSSAVTKNDISSGAIKLYVRFPSFSGDLIVQRSQDSDNFSTWTDVLRLNINAGDSTADKGFYIYDYLTRGDGSIYQYRFLKVENDEVTAVAQDNTYRIESIYEDIFLTNTNRQLKIKFNPNITNFKWVVQENITNTLGGIYPIIRRNGETKYRQFTLSGTLYFDPSIFNVGKSVDSQNKSMDDYFIAENSSLYLSIDEALSTAVSKEWGNRTTESKIEYYENRFKNSAMQFLIDGKPKLFRSPTEGLMLVMLTNISFTPNKQLGRRIVDFSATVTEFAEVSIENLIRYGIAPDIEYSYYVLVVNSTAINDYYITPYISESQVIEKDGDFYLSLVEKVVTL